MNLNLGVVLVKKDQLSNKKEGDKKTPKGTNLKLKIFILEMTAWKTTYFSKMYQKLKKIWVGVMIFPFQKNIINLLKSKKN